MDGRDRRVWRRVFRGEGGSSLPVLLVFAAIALALIAISAAFLGAVRAERAARDQAVRTSAVLSTLREGLQAGIDAETGQRGYLLTGDTKYLEPYALGAEAWPRALDDLERALQAEAPTQQETVARLRSLAEAKLAELAETIALSDAGRKAEALALVRSDEGQRLMEAYRADVAALRSIEERRLTDALLAAERAEGRNLPLVAVLLVLLAVLVGLMVWLQRDAAVNALAARDADALRRARDQADLVSRELNHRIKNIFAVVQSMVSLARRGETEPVRDVLQGLRERIQALATAHAVTRGELDASVADLGDLTRATLAPYEGSGAAITVGGPEVAIPARAVTPLGLVLHELATNASKYGALSGPEGRLDLSWTREGETVEMRWDETSPGETSAPQEEGFGSVLLKTSARQLGGEVTRRWEARGLQARLRFPLGAMSATKG